MPRFYITQPEAYVLSFLPSHQFYAEHRQAYHDYATPRLIADLLKKVTPDEAAKLLQYVIDRVALRYEKVKDRRLRYELACYRSWLANAQAQIIAQTKRPERTGTPSLIAAMKQIVGLKDTTNSHH